MDFGQFAKKLQASADKALKDATQNAKQAAEAARSFKGFDSMAEQDEYIHSEGLNVKPRRHNGVAGGSRQKQSSTAESQNISPPPRVSALSSAVWSSPPKVTAPDARQNSSNHQNTEVISGSRLTNFENKTGNKHCPERQRPMPLLSVVHDTLNSEKSRQINSSPNEEEEKDDDDEKDPLMAILRQDSGSFSKEGKASKMQSLEIESSDEESSLATSSSEKKKTHRFFEDLENKLRNPLEPCPADLDNIDAVEEKKTSSWLWNLASSQKNNAPSATENRKHAAPLSRSKKPKVDQLKEENDFDVVVSSAMLGNEEMRALTQLKQNSSNTNPAAALLRFAMRHPRETFIAFTLLVAVYVFFFNRNISTGDDAT